MKTIHTPSYQCDHCESLSTSKSDCEWHEIKCYAGPSRPERACFNCEHFTRSKAEDGDPFGQNTFNVFRCNKKDVLLVFSRSEPNLDKIAGEEVLSMPILCFDFQDNLPF